MLPPADGLGSDGCRPGVPLAAPNPETLAAGNAKGCPSIGTPLKGEPSPLAARPRGPAPGCACKGSFADPAPERPVPDPFNDARLAGPETPARRQMCDFAACGLRDGDAVLIDAHTPPWYKKAAVLVRVDCLSAAPPMTPGARAI